MRKILAILLLCPVISLAQSPKIYPNVSGDVLVQTQFDRIISTTQKGVTANNGFFYVEPKISVNFDKNWSMRTEWRLQPNNVLTTRDRENPERYRTFLATDRSFLNVREQGLLIEELKVHYENDDMRFQAGKFDPTFGTAWRKSKRIGVFAAQFNEDYNLREKLGASVSALLEGSQISFSSFMNDYTGLSNSMFNKRGDASSNGGIAGNGGFMSSYSLSMEGRNFVGIENWFYNFGYRNLSAENRPDRFRETGFVLGSEYLYKLGKETSVIPLFEMVSISNFGGDDGRDAKYATLAVIGKYSGWTASASTVTRNINHRTKKASSDRQIQFSIGYKFTDNLTLDISRANIKEDGKKGSLIGATMSYLYRF